MSLEALRRIIGSYSRQLLSMSGDTNMTSMWLGNPYCSCWGWVRVRPGNFFELEQLLIRFFRASHDVAWAHIFSGQPLQIPEADFDAELGCDGPMLQLF